MDFYGLMNMTENHGVPGSNPGPATSKSPAKHRKRMSFGGVSGTLCQWHVNSRLKKGPLQARLWGELHAFCGVGVEGQGQ